MYLSTIIMLNIKIHRVLFSLLVLMCIVQPCSADAFDDITAGLFTDAETFLKACVLAAVSIFAMFSILAVFVGWFGHNKSMFKMGLGGCGVIILGAIVYFISINGFNYIVTNYW